MPPLLVDPLTGAAIELLLSGLLGVLKIIYSSKTSGKELKDKLSSLKPIIEQISRKFESDSDSFLDRGKHFKDFQKAVVEDGLKLVEKLEKLQSFNFYRKYRCGRKIQKFDKKIRAFIDIQGSPLVVLDLHNIFEKICDLGERCDRIQCSVQKMTDKPTFNTRTSITQLNQSFIHGMPEATAAPQSVSCTSQVTVTPNEFVVGLDNLINGVKQILFRNDVNVVGVAGMGGSGKTTLALALCKDTQVQVSFPDRIIFITVSQLSDQKGLLKSDQKGLLKILETMWDEIIRSERPHFQSIEDAHRQLQEKLSLRTYPQILVVLDDVWDRFDLEYLLFEAKGYKTIITTRDNSIILKTKNAGLYSMPMLEDAHALSLFCFWAFDQPSIPSTHDENLVKQVEAECRGLPLALKVIGSSLFNEPQQVWENARKKLSRAESILGYHKKGLINRLETSIDVLDDKPKQCFLDLGAFPKGKKFSVDLLFDVWVYVRGMEREEAFVVLYELASRNLLNITSHPGSRAINFGCALEISFSQHDALRELALHLASKDSSILFMPHREDRIPPKWLEHKDQASKAQFVSIHTGPMKEQDWCQIDFSEVEVLALFFVARQYCLPTFLHSMPKLKVLIIYNYSSKRAKLDGLPGFPSFTQIKSVILERLIVPSLNEYCRSWESLEKLSACLCEDLGNMTPLDNEPVLTFPKVVEINLDHCSDLEELPGKICNLTFLQWLSVTNCHSIQKLPDDLERLRSLRVLRLSACLGLSMLPASICKLQQLEFLDISQCSYMKVLPEKFDQLTNLKTLDMRECSRLKKLPEAFAKLRSLRHVICDENIEKQWLHIKASAMPNLTVDVVKESFNLDWLYD